MAMSEQARRLRAEYKRNWQRRNRDKVKGYIERYWEKKAQEAAADPEKQEEARAII